MSVEYSEDCCWNYVRFYCKGAGCLCRCHVDLQPQAVTDERAARMETALREVEEDYEAMLSETVADVGRDWECPEDPEILTLCLKWGYGAVIARAAYLWQRRDPVGAFVQGPSLGIVQSNLKQVRAALARRRPTPPPAVAAEGGS